MKLKTKRTSYRRLFTVRNSRWRSLIGRLKSPASRVYRRSKTYVRNYFKSYLTKEISLMFRYTIK